MLPDRSMPLCAEDKIPLIICILDPFTGAQRFSCDHCGKHCYEDSRNVERVRAEKGFVICLACAIILKIKYPYLKVEAQMWNGFLRKPQPSAGYKFILDFLNSKP